MNQKTRHLDAYLSSHFTKYKQALILLGARQVGKTTILTRLFPNAQYFLLDNEPVRNSFETYDINSYKQIIKPNIKTLIVDEIHLLSNPGRAAKIIYDQLPSYKLILTGSSSLNIKNKTSESLAGRKIDYFLYPLTFSEFLYQKEVEDKLNYKILENLTSFTTPAKKIHLFDLEKTLENVLLFGLYPNLIDNPNDKLYLANLAESVVFKDILDLNLIESKNTALSLLKLLAFQIGNLVNYSEIAQRLNLDVRTVKKYLEIFEQSFIIFRIYPYSSKKRDEIGKSPKVYFYDLGIRNALIENYTPLRVRNDSGALFENFIISEFLKQNNYGYFGYKLNFWRTKQGSEIDLVISKDKILIGVEIKFKKGKLSKAFANRYPEAKTVLITSDNFY